MFKLMKQCLDPKANPTDEELQKISSYQFCRWLSGHPSTILAANAINTNYDIPIENQFRLIQAAFAGKIRYIPYPKKESEEKTKQIEYLAEHFKINLTKAKEYLEFISQEELDEIVEMYSNVRR